MNADQLKTLAIDANGETWACLQKPTLTPDEREQMKTSAYASLYLWGKAGGTSLHKARGHWLISRVMCLLNEPNLADQHALQCERFTRESGDRKDFDDMYAVEARARSAALKKDAERAKALKCKAEQLLEDIQDPEDKKIAAEDLHAGPWFGLSVG